MAAQLWFLRHGEAEPHGTRPDHDRALTVRGREQARIAGVALRRLDVPIAHVFTSPKVRARDTALLAAAAAGFPLPSEHDELVDLDRDAALALAAAGGDHEHVLLVGHEPDFSQVAHDLTGVRADVKKGGVVGIRLDAPGELLVLLRPRELAAIAGTTAP